MGKAIKAKYKDGVIRPLKKLDIPDDTDLTIIIKISDETNKAKKREWYEWGGILEGTNALQELEQEHKREILDDEGS